MKRTPILMNKLAYLGLSTFEISNIVMHEFWYDYAKPKYEEKAKLCSMDRSSFIVCIKTEDIYSAISRCWNKFDTLNYELETPLPEEKNWINERWIQWKNNDRICCIETKNIQQFNRWQWWKNKKANGRKKSVIKRKL